MRNLPTICKKSSLNLSASVASLRLGFSLPDSRLQPPQFFQDAIEQQQERCDLDRIEPVSHFALSLTLARVLAAHIKRTPNQAKHIFFPLPRDSDGYVSKADDESLGLVFIPR